MTKGMYEQKASQFAHDFKGAVALGGCDESQHEQVLCNAKHHIGSKHPIYGIIFLTKNLKGCVSYGFN